MNAIEFSSFKSFLRSRRELKIYSAILVIMAILLIFFIDSNIIAVCIIIHINIIYSTLLRYKDEYYGAWIRFYKLGYNPRVMGSYELTRILYYLTLQV